MFQIAALQPLVVEIVSEFFRTPGDLSAQALEWSMRCVPELVMMVL